MIMTFDEFRKLKTGRASLPQYINNNFPELYADIIKLDVNADFKTKSYMYFNNMTEFPKCKICGKPTTFFGYDKGFAAHCSKSCRAKDESVEIKRINTLKTKYGDNFTDIIINKSKQTCLEKYGAENPMQSEIVKNKIKQTCLKRYGAENPMQSEIVKNKSKQTCLEKYGSPFYFASDECKKNHKKNLKKIKLTCLDRYGVENIMQSEIIKDKVKQTCLEKYGVQWNCMRPEIYQSNRNNSYANTKFSDLLNQKNIKYNQEFPLQSFIYDFKINNILLEINPAATHNITWSPYPTNRIDKYYHFNKSRCAINNNYRCIHIWEWDDINKIINTFSNKQKVAARKCEIKEVSKNECNLFLNKYHFQNTCNNQTIRLGLYYNNELISIMTFGKPRYNKNYEYELLRLCTNNKYIIIGGSKKLFNYFIKTYNPATIISYCDMSKFDGNIYKELGFKLKNGLQPSLHWYNPKTHIHITNNLLLQRGFDQLFNTNYGKNSSNRQLMLDNGFVEIYDSGQATYIWKS